MTCSDIPYEGPKECKTIFYPSDLYSGRMTDNGFETTIRNMEETQQLVSALSNIGKQEPTPEQSQEYMRILSEGGMRGRSAGEALRKHVSECTDETCEKYGKTKPKSGVQWRLSALAKGQHLPGKGFTYLHIRVNTKRGHVTGFKTVPTKQKAEFYQQVAGVMYNELIEKYG